MFHVPEKYRVMTGVLGSDETYCNNGVFKVPLKKSKRILSVIVSDQEGWEHVSVSLPDRTPTWEEMCAIKNLFWGPEDTVVQYHPPESGYVNLHEHCLHLWREIGSSIPTPPTSLV